MVCADERIFSVYVGEDELKIVPKQPNEAAKTFGMYLFHAGCKIYVEQTFVTMGILASAALTSHQIVVKQILDLFLALKSIRFSNPRQCQQYFYSQRRTM